MIGVISGNALIENCTSEIAVKAPSRTGGLIGGIVLNNGLGTPAGTELDLAAGAEVIVRGCTNNGNVTGTSGRIGGVVGLGIHGQDGRTLLYA